MSDAKGVEELVARAVSAGDAAVRVEAFAELVRRFQDMAFAYAYAVLGDFHLAEDAAQEAFLTAYLELARLRRPQAFAGWLRRIVRTACSRLRRARPLAPAPLTAAEGLRSDTPEPVEAAEANEMRDAIEAAVGSLPETQRVATTLFYIDGYSQKEIAAFLELPVTTVNNRLAAARKRLNERMLKLVADTLQAAKPGGEFVARVRRIIALRKAGSKDRARKEHADLLEALKALQGRGKFEDVVRAHEDMVAAIRTDGTYDDMCHGSFEAIARSYHEVGRPRKLAEGILAGLPELPPPEHAIGFANLLRLAAEAFAAAGQYERAEGQLNRILNVAEMLEGTGDSRWLRNVAMDALRGLALEQGRTKRAKALLESIYENLKGFEKDLAAACPQAASMADAQTEAQRQWLQRLGDTYHNLAVRCAFHGWGDRKEALRFMRRAAELRFFAPTHVLLARLVLSVEQDRTGALEHLQTAAADAAWREFVKEQFHQAAEFEPVRRDGAFQAAVSA